MAKKVQMILSALLPAQQATAETGAIGPALGEIGVNVQAFCDDFNKATGSVEAGTPMATVVTVYVDKSYTFTAIPQY